MARLAAATRALTPRRGVLLVGCAYLAVQALAFSPHRGPSWDEAVYLSQVSPRMPAVFFAPSRARGITLLVAPVAAVTGSIAAVRVYLAVASAAALTGVFLLWASIIGWAAPVAAFIAAFSWLGLFYGSEVMPNLWVGLLAVAALGFWARHLDGGRPSGDRALAAACLGVMALFRPLDVVAVAIVLAGWAVVRRVDVVRELGAVAVGLAAGAGPWVIEMTVRFGNPAAAVRGAATTGHVGPASFGTNALQHLYLTDGPTIGPDPSARIPALGLCWWVGLLALVTLAIMRSRGRRAPVVGATAWIGAAFAVEYLVFVSSVAPRFLLPLYSVLAVAAGIGLTALRGRRGGRAALVVGLGLVVVWAAFQIDTARRVERSSSIDRARLQTIGSELGRLAGGRPCSFTSADGFPEVQYASGCLGHPLREPPAPPAAARGTAEFLVAPRSMTVPAGWRKVGVAVGSGGHELAVYESAG